MLRAPRGRWKLRAPGGQRLLRTASQFGRLRLTIAGAVGIALLGAGVWADPLSKPGVVLVSLGTGVLASTVVAAIALEREDFAQTVLGFGVQEVFADRSLTFDNHFWNWLINTTSHRYGVLGVANHGYLRNPLIRADTEKAIVDAIARRVNVE